MDQRLETFLTVCSTMNYRRAAERLHLTQPAVTKQIQALEALYGVRLFTYDSRKLKKTPQGETLEIYAISQRYQDEELRRALRRQEKTSLRIGATKSIGDYILPPQISRFLKEPDNELFFTVDNTAHLLAQLEGGELDFVVLEGIFDKSRYESFLLRDEPYIGICAKDHPFSGREVTMDELLPSGSSCASRAPAHERSSNESSSSAATRSRHFTPMSASAASSSSGTWSAKAAA